MEPQRYSAAYYRAQAEKARKLARASYAETKKMLIEVARHYDELAAELSREPQH